MTEGIPAHWLLVAKRGDGKSTFASQMSPKFVVLNFDGRWGEQEDVQPGKSIVFSGMNVLEITEKMRKSGDALRGTVGTVVVDSGTTLLDGIIARGTLEEEQAKRNGQKFNKNSTMRLKADTMRVLRAAVMSYSCDTLWIFHFEDSSFSGKTRQRTTIPRAELDRLMINLNARLTIVRDSNGMRGIKIEWARRADYLQGHTIWDRKGMFKGIPDKLRAFLNFYEPSMGYNGNEYSYAWLVEHLASKDVVTTVEELTSKYGAEPFFFDRAAFGKMIDQETE